MVDTSSSWPPPPPPTTTQARVAETTQAQARLKSHLSTTMQVNINMIITFIITIMTKTITKFCFAGNLWPREAHPAAWVCGEAIIIERVFQIFSIFFKISRHHHWFFDNFLKTGNFVQIWFLWLSGAFYGSPTKGCTDSPCSQVLLFSMSLYGG